MKKIFLVLTIALLGGITLLFVNRADNQPEQPVYLTAQLSEALDKYFLSKNKNEINIIKYTVERSSLEKNIIIDDAKVTADKNLDLAFQFSGIIDKVFVDADDIVNTDKILIKQDANELEFERRKIKALISQNEANLEKLMAGATKEDIKISETKVNSALISIKNAKNHILKIIEDSYTKADETVRSKADQIFLKPIEPSPRLNLFINDAQLETDAKIGRLQMENLLNRWSEKVRDLTMESDIESALAETKNNLKEVDNFLNQVSLALNKALSSINISDGVITGYKTEIFLGRKTLQASLVGLASEQEALDNANSALALAESELNFKKAGARIEDVQSARASLQEAQNQLKIVENKIGKTILRSPQDSLIVKKVWFKEGELAQTGIPVISLSSVKQKIQADVPEADIGSVAPGNRVTIQFDTFKNKQFTGKVVSIEPKEIIEDDDVFYRTNIELDSPAPQIRSGMTAKVTLNAFFKEDVLKVPDYLIYQKDGQNWVTILEPDGQVKEVVVETGISDKEMIEIKSGLKDGDIIINP